jgi:hypothetical protein
MKWTFNVLPNVTWPLLVVVEPEMYDSNLNNARSGGSPWSYGQRSPLGHCSREKSHRNTSIGMRGKALAGATTGGKTGVTTGGRGNGRLDGDDWCNGDRLRSFLLLLDPSFAWSRDLRAVRSRSRFGLRDLKRDVGLRCRYDFVSKVTNNWSTNPFVSCWRNTSSSSHMAPRSSDSGFSLFSRASTCLARTTGSASHLKKFICILSMMKSFEINIVSVILTMGLGQLWATTSGPLDFQSSFQC